MEKKVGEIVAGSISDKAAECSIFVEVYKATIIISEMHSVITRTIVGKLLKSRASSRTK